MDYKEKFCFMHDATPREVADALYYGVFPKNRRHKKRDDDILRALFRGDSRERVASRHRLSVGRIRDIEKLGQNYLLIQVWDRRKKDKYSNIASYSQAAEVLNCTEDEIHKVIGNPRLCLERPDRIHLDLFIERLEGVTITDLGEKFKLEPDEVRGQLTVAAQVVGNSIGEMRTQVEKWDTDRFSRSPSRMSHQWGVPVEYIRTAMNEVLPVKLYPRSFHVMTGFIEGQSAEETVKESGVPYSLLEEQFRCAWNRLRPRLRAMKETRMMELARQGVPVSEMNLEACND